MKVGDLVRWTYAAGDVDIGIVGAIDSGGQVYIVWSDGSGNGLYNPSHPMMELISESR